ERSGVGIVVRVEAAEREFEGFESFAEPDHLLLHRARPAELPERVALRLLDEALDALLEMLDAAGDGVLARLEGVLTDADEVVEEAARERAAAPSLLGDDLGQDLHRHVLA